MNTLCNVFQHFNSETLLPFPTKHYEKKRFCPLSKPSSTLPPSPPLFLTDNINMNRIPTKIKWKNACPFYIIFQVLKVLLIKCCKNSHQIFYFLLFLLAFTSADIIFHKVLELHPTLSEKKIFVTNFPFLMDSLKPPQPLIDEKPLSSTKVFLPGSLIHKRLRGNFFHQQKLLSYLVYFCC